MQQMRSSAHSVRVEGRTYSTQAGRFFLSTGKKKPEKAAPQTEYFHWDPL